MHVPGPPSSATPTTPAEALIQKADAVTKGAETESKGDIRHTGLSLCLLIVPLCLCYELIFS